ncbi:MAG: response regulator [Treponema sp.]|jgi:CheY-like chemotaxis protein|nr:response regulator [Treponema sp.]
MEAFTHKDDDSLSVTRVSNRSKILVVDDMPTFLAYEKTLLAPYYDVTVAKTGKETLDILEREFLDAVLLDIKMPDMSGIDVFSKMQAHPEFRSIPVIFVTSEKEIDTIQKAAAMGAKDYVIKPFDTKTVLAKIQRALKQAREDQALLFLRRKMHTLCEYCSKGNVAAVEDIIKDIPRNVYNAYVFLKINRILLALHNQELNQAVTIAQEVQSRIKTTLHAE